MIYVTLFLEFFKIGLFCFGGAFGMIPIIKDVVLKYEWMTEADFYSFIGVCESTPGPIAVNLATYIGSTRAGLLGSFLSVLGVVLPSFIVILLIASVLKNFTENKYFKAVMSGIKPVVVALILYTGITFLLETVGVSYGKADISSIVLFCLTVGLHFIVTHVFKKKLSSVFLILISAVLGISVGIIENMLFV
ncbi:MAG: chromate transporter [Ruminococcaceae bacterium]|nr:chromate transporter [Oscillospiraceae bacterium]